MVKQAFAGFYALLAFIVLVPSYHAAFGIEGVLLIRTAKGNLENRPAVLNIPDKFQGDIELVLPGGKIATSDFTWTKFNGKDLLVILFTHLPKAAQESVLAFKGSYVVGERFNGEVLTVATAPGKAAPSNTDMLKSLVNDPTDANFQHKGTFYFTAGRVAGPSKPKVEINPPSTDRNNPCPNGPCWSNGGVGRHLEYYPGGPIQNPGRPSVAASFNRGTPYAWSREAQIEGQRVGIEKSRAFYEHIDSYARPYWGFWGFPWLWW